MKKVLIPLFLFLIVLTPAYAYLPIDKNVSGNGGFGFACSNLTGTLYCYNLYQSGSTTGIGRYNGTLGGYKSCDTGTIGAYAFTYTKGLYIANSTHIILLRSDGYRLVPINNMTDSTTCTSTNTLTPALNESYPTTAELPTCGAAGSELIFCGYENGIRYSLNNTWVTGGFWDVDNIEGLYIPNVSDNSTAYGIYDNLLFKYIGGAFNSSTVEIDTAWGIAKPTSPISQYSIDMFKEGSTTWLYVQGSGNRFYRLNMTEAEGVSGGSAMVAVHPTGNETLADTTPELHGIVYSILNGTVGWYVDGLFKENNTITTDGVSVDAYFTTDTLATGNHYWSATFYDSAGYTWSTGTQYFIVNKAYEGSDYTGDDQVEALGDYLDTAFSSPFGGEIFALIMSGLIAGVIWYYSGHSKIEFLLAPLMFILACFSFIGMFPMWFMVLEVITVAVFIFFKVR